MNNPWPTYGNGLLAFLAEVSMTLQLSVFWVLYVMAFGCAVVVLVTLYHLFHPAKALLKP